MCMYLIWAVCKSEVILSKQDEHEDACQQVLQDILANHNDFR